MKKIIVFALALASVTAWGGEPWKFSLQDKEARIGVHVDLYAPTVEVPGMEMFGPMNGYLAGPGLYGTWMVTSAHIKNAREATLRASNDLGSETQEIRLQYANDSTIVLTLTGTTVMKKVIGGRKLAKIEPRLVLNVN